MSGCIFLPQQAIMQTLMVAAGDKVPHHNINRQVVTPQNTTYSPLKLFN